MPRLKCTYAEFLAILLAHGFVLQRHDGGSHRRYRGEHSGQVWLVTYAPHSESADIGVDVLSSMIRQSGLPKKLFRK